MPKIGWQSDLPGKVWFSWLSTVLRHEIERQHILKLENIVRSYLLMTALTIERQAKKGSKMLIIRRPGKRSSMWRKKLQIVDEYEDRKQNYWQQEHTILDKNVHHSNLKSVNLFYWLKDNWLLNVSFHRQNKKIFPT